MKKILLIIQREYLTRVKKKSFIVMTILGPVLMASIFIIPIYLATRTDEIKTIAVIDETGFFYEKFKNSETIHFRYLDTDIHGAKENFSESGDYAILYIPRTEVTLPSNAILYANNQVNISVKSYVKTTMSKRIEEMKLEAQLRALSDENNRGINIDDFLRSIKTNVDINTIKITGDGQEEKSYTEISTAIAMFGSILIYFFIFMFGSQIMRGVIEEKTSRIIEVIVSSVKPFQLMMGKIVGVALVGLTQFLLWVVFTFIIITAVTTAMHWNSPSQPNLKEIIVQQNQGFADPTIAESDVSSGDSVNEVLEAINSINFPVMIGSFLFFFLFGYLMYAALFAAIGGAVDSEADTQQFVLPLTAPLILSIVLAQVVIRNPEGPLAFWLSIIPLTSPVMMMIRIPFGVPWGQAILSMVLLLIGFIGTTWVAAKIYRTGILMYGKKVGYQELWRWLKH